jgi:hypothetical protein
MALAESTRQANRKPVEREQKIRAEQQNQALGKAVF